MLELGILKIWNSTTYKAGVQLVGSLTTYLDNISVSVSIPSSAMVVGNYVLVAIPGGNPRDACVVASWPQGSSGGGGGGSFYALTEMPAIWRCWNNPVSSTARNATIQSVADDVITLTANPKSDFGDWGDAPEQMHADNVYVMIRNTTRNQNAWIKGAPTNTQLRVTDAADIATWQNGDTIRTHSSANANYVELDVSPVIPDGATMLFLKTQAQDSGAMAASIGLQVSKEGVAGSWNNTFCQVTGFVNTAFPPTQITTARHLTVRDRATGADTLNHAVRIIAYIK
jgi:hypothetical protein